MNDISMCLEHIADAIRNLDPFANSLVKVRSIQVGMEYVWRQEKNFTRDNVIWRKDLL